MSKLPIPHIINTIKTKLGFDRTMTASGEDVVDAVNKQSTEIANVQNGLAYIVGDTNTTGSTLANGTFVYVKGHSTIAEGLREVTSPISASGSITINNTEACTVGGLNALNSKLSYKAGDSVTFVNPTEFAGRLGWQKTRVIFSVPMDRKIDHFTSASLSGNIGVYADNTIKVCTATFNSATISSNILCLRYDITPASAWASSDDTTAIVELNDSLTINF